MIDPTSVDLQQDHENLFENTMAGNVIVSKDGDIVRINKRMATWLGTAPEDVSGKRFADLLTMGGKIYLETHLSPMLRMQSEFEEVMLELKTRDGSRIPVLVGGFEQRDASGAPLFSRFTVIRATSRMSYEKKLRHEGKQARDALTAAEGTLLDERQTSALREQFIAVLGHDLRNPLAAIDAGVRMIAKSQLDGKLARVVPLLQASVLRMGGLIDDVMDFARGRLGGGLAMNLQSTDLRPFIQQVVNELSEANPARRIEADLQITIDVTCDGPKIAQLVSNLLANALTHGSADGAILLTARPFGNGIELAVENEGLPIPQSALERLFEPFTREAGDGKQGLGLGLYIASEIAKGHGGRLSVTSDEAKTVFRFKFDG